MENNSNMPKRKKPFYRRGWFILLLIIVIICIIFSIRGALQKAASQKVTYTWPDSALAAMIPQPESEYGKIHMENEEYLYLEVYKISKTDFEAYIEKCKENGFSVDYLKTDTSYDADNDTGYSLNLIYDEKNESLDISLSAPEPENVSADLPPEHSDNGERSGETDTELSTPDRTENESAPEAPSDSKAGTSEGIRPEFKEALDGYEAFIDEYCEFMKKYSEADAADLLSMAADYSDMMQKELEWAQKLEELDDGSLSTEETAYYLEVTSRVSQKMLDVVQ